MCGILYYRLIQAIDQDNKARCEALLSQLQELARKVQQIVELDESQQLGRAPQQKDRDQGGQVPQSTDQEEEKKDSGLVSIARHVTMASVHKFIGRRGPDSQVALVRSADQPWQKIAEDQLQQEAAIEAVLQPFEATELAYASVLHLRGESTHEQPFVDGETGCTLLYNGEIFEVDPACLSQELSIFVTSELLAFDCQGAINDGLQLHRLLVRASQMTQGDPDRFELMVNELKWLLANFFIESDLSFVYIDRVNNAVLTHRDFYGKRSLVIHAHQVPSSDSIELLFSSCQMVQQEDAASSCSCCFEQPSNSLLILRPEANDDASVKFMPFEIVPSVLRFGQRSQHQAENPSQGVISAGQLAEVKSLMLESVHKRTKSIPFDRDAEHSGVIVMFSGGLDSTLIAAMACEVLPPEISVDLVNVSFAPATSADRFTAIFSFHDLKRLYPGRALRLICADYSMEQVLEDATEGLIIDLCRPKQSLMDFNIAAALHFAAKGEGYEFDAETFFASPQFNEELLPKMLRDDQSSTMASGSYDHGVITNKINSIDPALYYKKSGGGDGAPSWIKSPSKVVFSGLGADEVWAGYSRYKTAALRGGLTALQAEMSLDLDRLWHRNMGRDDRAISVHGKEARFPFLDRAVQTWLRESVPDMDATDGACTLYATNEQRGMGDKRLLRRIALECFDLGHAGTFEKRAIHFGTKIAKQINVRKFGSNRKANGKAQYTQEASAASNCADQKAQKKPKKRRQ